MIDHVARNRYAAVIRDFRDGRINNTELVPHWLSSSPYRASFFGSSSNVAATSRPLPALRATRTSGPSHPKKNWRAILDVPNQGQTSHRTLMKNRTDTADIGQNIVRFSYYVKSKLASRL